MEWRIIQISRPHRQFDIQRSEIGDKATNRFEGESMEIGFRREAIPLAYQAGHQLAVIALSLFFVTTHIVTAFKIGDGLCFQGRLNLQAIFVASPLPVADDFGAPPVMSQ
jgi:hypothetical protein